MPIKPLTRIFGTVLFVAACTSSMASDDTISYLHAGTLIDTVAGQVLRDQIVVIRNGRIESVDAAAAVDVPDDAHVVDLSDRTVLPGLIDMHVHLTSDASLHGYNRLGRSAIRSALYGARAARTTLEAGFTTVRNVGAAAYGDVALRDAINDDDVPGPRMRVSGPSVGITGGHCDNNLLPPEYEHRSAGVADGPWAVREQVRKNVKYGADLIKFCATGGVLSRGTTIGARQFTPEEMSALVDEAHTLGLKVAAHAHGTAGIRAAIRAGTDTIDHASLLDDEAIELAVEHDTTLVMDVYVTEYILGEGEAAGILQESLERERQVGAAQRESFRRAHEAGVRIAFGTDAGVFPHGQNARQFYYMVDNGMTPMQAIQAATVAAAHALGWSDSVGAIAPGHHADLIAVRGNPLEDIRLLESVDFVMKGGEVVLDRAGD